jgi:hypothetical protein
MIGYLPKRSAVPEHWRSLVKLDHITEICSVSNCIASPPEGWSERGLHNEFGFFNTRGYAELILPDPPDDFSLFAYRLWPVRFKKHRTSTLGAPHTEVEPVPPEWITLGFDVVSRTIGSSFGCSPLSCNGLANEVFGVNRYCLMDTLDEALALAERFSQEEPEPGPYYVIEVLRAADHQTPGSSR